ncbi:flagellar protein FlaG [Cellvibrio japonicus]|uniref:FlaG n=1 Tax=Cellvibrio japonicus (strain Ueda107) TaxID=498211 RepID=B3PGR5_CELJU|nr:flagellar protein FlaG [Cellvibrio japonicus]ACE86191.1 FlaG [Cellvibrio japonicus Ueda107]QEI12410.1 flagellar protein FlaG [Cellvibrio japonicus]QEI15983.1 flagellar protein FlaG [Cellvibrio japonicus]QEI19562.1 flagellar protein FlaG [Cellvibrio japonicus]
MNEVTKITSTPVQTKSVPVSSLPGQIQLAGSGQGQKTGNPLPPAVEAAKSRPLEGVDPQEIQEKITAAVAQMNEYIQSTQRDLQFTYDPGSGETVVKVLDRETQELIRQIPDETFLRIAQHLSSEEPVRLFSAEA